MSDALLKVIDLKKYFNTADGQLRAVDGVSFSLKKNETFGLVGESGCGKTTLGRTILRLVEPSDGQIYFDGKDIVQLSENEMRRTRQNMQIVFQDPYGSLHSRMKIFDIIARPLRIHGLYENKRRERVEELLGYVKLPSDAADKYAHEFSGGQRQRIAVARAIATNPKFIVLDEPTSSLDVSIQGTILNLLLDLQRTLKMSYLFISHNINVVRQMSNDIAVMYIGKIVEKAQGEQLFKSPLHPYTRMLISALIIPGIKKESKAKFFGEPPSLFGLPPGCRFYLRCPNKKEICKKNEPHMIEIENGHFVACNIC